MHIIIMNKDKTLYTSKRVSLYEGDNFADKIRFLFPETYNDILLKDCSVRLHYNDSNGEECYDELVKDEDLYKGRLSYRHPIDSDFTEFARDIVVYITFSRINPDTNKEEIILHTGSCVISISPLPGSDTTTIIPDNSVVKINKEIEKISSEMESFERVFPNKAEIGQMLAVKAIDANGKPAEYKCVTGSTTVYEYAKDGGYIGTEEEFAEKLAQENPTKEEFNKLSKKLSDLENDMELGGKQVQPDYNQNDETAPDYIKNKTHWYEEGGAVVLEETILSVGDDSMANMPGELLLIGDVSYDVNYNGVIYHSTAFETSDGETNAILLGNYGLALGYGEDTGEPFVIMYAPNEGGMIFCLDGTISMDITLSIKKGNTYHTLSNEYLDFIEKIGTETLKGTSLVSFDGQYKKMSDKAPNQFEVSNGGVITLTYSDSSKEEIEFTSSDIQTDENALGTSLTISTKNNIRFVAVLFANKSIENLGLEEGTYFYKCGSDFYISELKVNGFSYAEEEIKEEYIPSSIARQYEVEKLKDEISDIKQNGTGSGGGNGGLSGTPVWEMLASGSLPTGLEKETSIDTGLKYSDFDGYEMIEVTIASSTTTGANWSLIPKANNSLSYRLTFTQQRGKLILSKFVDGYWKIAVRNNQNVNIANIGGAFPGAYALGSTDHKDRILTFDKSRNVILMNSELTTSTVTWYIRGLKVG